MKRWTVMLVPEGLGSTRTLSLCSPQLWVLGVSSLVLLLLLATFLSATAFLYRTHVAAQRHIRDLQRINRELAQEQAAVRKERPEQAVDERVLADFERRIREEYEAGNRAIAAELSRLRDEEEEIRKLYGLSPRANSAAEWVTADARDEDGRGGPPGHGAAVTQAASEPEPRPPHVIYGLARPSADLILEEIRVRIESLRELRDDTLAAQDKVARTPSGWPVRHAKRRITSRHGYRKDPFTYAVRHHEGLDISAPHGSPVYATARGVVTSSGWENYYGHTVRISHGSGHETVYAHLSRVLVRAGQQINRGDEIGRLGSTGRSTGPHLHYEVRVRGAAKDPEEYLPVAR